ncbi:MAG: hypothetical protein Q9M33_13305, partial [Robiginitomaculum sp.]|nr:hypothetical protein [Robiginitomaculum sp.]
PLQNKIVKIRKRHVQNHRLLAREVSRYVRMSQTQKDAGRRRSHENERQDLPHKPERKRPPSLTPEP